MDHVARGPKGHRRWAMDYIPNRTLYLAVMFARSMIRSGTSPGIAVVRAARYYRVMTKDVARYTGQCGGTYAHRPRRG